MMARNSVILSIAFISLIWMMDPQRRFFVVPSVGKFEIPIPIMQLVNKEEKRKRQDQQQYQQNPIEEQQGSKHDQPGSKHGHSGQKEGHLSKTTVIKSNTIKLKSNREKRYEFVMKRGNPQLQLERFCPICPLNAACFINASEFWNQKFITWEMARIGTVDACM